MPDAGDAPTAQQLSEPVSWHREPGSGAFRTNAQGPVRGLVVACALALLLIALLALAMHFALERILTHQEHSSVLLDATAEQRLLAQRVALMARDVAAPETVLAGDEAQVQRRLGIAVERMARNHRAITGGELDGELPRLHQELTRELYRAGTEPLGDRVTSFLARAEALLDAPPPDREALLTEVARLVRSAEGLIATYDAILQRHRLEAADFVSTLRIAERAALISLWLTLLAIGWFVFRPLIRHVESYDRDLRELATVDGLTRLLNRRAFRDAVLRELERADRHGLDMALALIDIDHFKRVNDDHGHGVGDRVLAQVGEVLRRCVRDADVLGRLGGEEIGVCMPHTSSANAIVAAERIRASLAEERFVLGDVSLRLTVSIGVARREPGEGLDSLVDRADAALYEAKRTGRDRVVEARVCDAVVPRFART